MKTVEIHPIQESQALLVGWLHPYYEEMAHRKKTPLRRNLPRRSL